MQSHLGLFQDDPAPEVLAARLANLRDRNVTVTLPDGTVYTAQAANRPHPDYDRTQRAAGPSGGRTTKTGGRAPNPGSNSGSSEWR